MVSEMKKIIFDVGANNGESTAAYLKDESVELYAFEPNPFLFRDIQEIHGVNPHYHPFQYAIGDKEGNMNFHLAGPVDPMNVLAHRKGMSNWGCSSLLDFSPTVVDEWEHRPDFQSVGLFPVEVRRLDSFVKEHSISSIDYLHIDAQGMDLRVLQSLGDKLSIVKAGVLEAPINERKKIYTESHTASEAILYLLNNNFRITSIEKNDPEGNEVNIYFAEREA